MKKNIQWYHYFTMFMKINALQFVISLICTICAQAHDTHAQEQLFRKVSMHMMNKPVDAVLNKIEKETGVRFVYSPELVDVTRRISVTVTNESVLNVLTNHLRPIGISFEATPKVIILSPGKVSGESKEKDKEVQEKEVLRKVTGSVKDERNAGLPGVSILVKGTQLGTTTDADGNFVFENLEENAVLVFSFVGYVSQEVEVLNRTDLSISLKPDPKDLEELVVVGYGVQKRANVTGAVATIESKFLEDRPITNASQALQGAPGLYVNMSKGRPGADGATIRIRGVGSFGTANDPLVLVDGVQYSLREINPADIETISVLKDAASASIYGNRAANGVVLITTKKGKAGKFRTDYNVYSGFQQATTFPDVVTNTIDYMNGKNLALRNIGQADEYSPELIAEYKNGKDPYTYSNTNWFDVMFRKARQTEHNLRFSGGNDKSTFSVSLGYLNQDGVLLGSGAKRYSLSTNIQSDVTKRIKIGAGIITNFWDFRESGYSADEGNGEGGIMGLIYRGLPMQTSVLADGRYADQWVRVPGHNFFRNPYPLVMEGFKKDREVKSLINLSAEVKLPWDLKYKVTLAPALYYQTRKINNPSIDLVNPKTLAIAPLTNGPVRGVQQSTSNEINFTNYHTLNWDKTLGKHQIGGLLGYSFEILQNGSFNAQNQGQFANEISELGGGSSNPTVGGTSSESRLMSFFGRANYAFNDRYLFEANFRYDGASRFAEGHRWGLFPSLSAGWRLSEEEWLKNVRALSNLKLRASWGQLGSQPQQLYGYLSSVSAGSNYSFNNTVVTGAAIGQIADPRLTWETSTMTDIGLEFGLFNNRLSGEFDWYRKLTTGILRQVTIPQQVGNLGGPVRNVGDVENKGLELTLNWQDKIGDFGYNIGGNMTTIHNKVLNTNGEKIYNGNRVIFEGYSIDSYYGYSTLGLFRSDAEALAAPLQNGIAPKAGDVRYADLNGDKVVDDKDRTIIGNTIPKMTYSFTMGASYKGFDFSAFFQGVTGVSNYVNANLGFPYRNGAGVTKDWLANAWTAENPNAKYPRLTPSDRYPTNYMISDFWLRNASYLRLKNVQLGYTFPTALTNKLRIQKLKVYVNAQNILTFADFTLGDPERDVANESIIAYPIAKTVTAGLNLTF